jgi:lipoprotein-releasing system permease protein
MTSTGFFQLGDYNSKTFFIQTPALLHRCDEVLVCFTRGARLESRHVYVTQATLKMMYRPLALFIGLRFVRARKNNQLMSFVTVISMLGIALGVLALIAVLSVINASTSTMRAETLKAVPHAGLVLPAGAVSWAEATELLQQQPGIAAAAPFISAEAWLRFEGRGEFVNVRGVHPVLEPTVLQQPDAHLAYLLAQLDEAPDGIILGTRLASRLGIYTGAPLSATPLATLLTGSTEGARSFRLLGVADFGFYDNERTALIRLPEAERLFTAAQTGSSSQISTQSATQSQFQSAAPMQIRLRVTDLFNARQIADQAVSVLPQADYSVSSWNETRRSLFDALRMEKVLTGFMLLMIVIIGAVNIVATLVMAVADKSADIAILRTMGASRVTVMAVFVIQGFAAGVLGTVLGAAGGIALSLSIGDITRWFENWLNQLMAPGDVYMIAHLTAELEWSDVVLVCTSALVISLLATLYPAWRASRIQPADVLRYE